MRCDILKLENENLKGWIKLKSKKILGLLLVVTLLSATVFGSVSVSAAGAQTNVKLESYMPPVKTIFVDDDFENRAEGELVAPIAEGETGYRANQVKSIDKTVVAGKESGNTYAKYSTTYSRVDLCDKIISTQAKKMVISFKFDMRTFAAAKLFTLRFGNQMATKAFQFQMTGSNGVRISKYNTSGVTQIIQNINKDKKNEWVDFKVILSKDDIDNGALIEKIFVDGKEIEIPSTVDRQLNSDCNWWKEAASNNSVKTINIGENAAENLRLDNILIYEPYDVYMKDANIVNKSVTIVNDSAAEVSGKVFLALYDENKNLVYATEYTGEVKVPANDSLPVALTGEINVPNAKSAKIFFWDKGSLAPHCSAQEISLIS